MLAHNAGAHKSWLPGFQPCGLAITPNSSQIARGSRFHFLRLKLAASMLHFEEYGDFADYFGPRWHHFLVIAPLAGGLGKVEDHVEQFPLAVLSGSPSLARLGKTAVDELPFGVRQIRSVSHPQGYCGKVLPATAGTRAPAALTDHVFLAQITPCHGSSVNLLCDEVRKR
jgi:hypothetical protein